MTITAFRDTLARMGAEDQAGRDSIAIAAARGDSLFLQRIIRNDSTRTHALQALIAKHGWPRRSVVGDTAARAAWLIVQHSPLQEFQDQMLPLLGNAAKRGEINAADVALLVDRVHVRKGEPQRYGTQFVTKGGRLVPDSIAELTALDSLRASVGLPSMAEYVRMLAAMYRMPVQWPPSRSYPIRP